MESNKSSGQEKRDDVVAIDLPAPEGWKKKFTPKKGGTPRRNEIVFISPTGEEIRNKRQLDQYLKSHPGGPSVSEFDWGTGDTPRRSARISEKSKAEETPEPEPHKKMQRKSSSKKGVKEKKGDNDGEVEAATEEAKASADREAATEETKGSADVEMKDVETAEDKEASVEKTQGSADREANTEETKKSAEVEMKDEADVGEVATEEAFAGKDTVKDSEHKTEIMIDKTTMQKNMENLEASNEATSGAKKEDARNESLLMPGLELNDMEAEKEQAEPKSEVVKVDHPGKETLTEIVASVEKVKPDSDRLKNQEGGKAMENHLVNCEEASHEPKTSQASC